MMPTLSTGFMKAYRYLISNGQAYFRTRFEEIGDNKFINYAAIHW